MIFYRFRRFLRLINIAIIRTIIILIVAVIGLSLIPSNNETINHLEYTQHFCNWIEIVAVFLVLLGVLLEKDTFPEEIKALGWDILMVGLALEFLLAFDLLQLNSKIEGRSAVQVAQLQRETAAALDDAAKANETTAILKHQEEPRTLTGDEAASLAILTMNFTGQKFFIAVSSRDLETYEFAKSLIEILDAASWNSGGEKAPVSVPILTVGVVVLLNQHEPKNDQTTLSANVLAKFLYDQGFSQTSASEYDSDWANILGTISVIVGAKIPLQTEGN